MRHFILASVVALLGAVPSQAAVVTIENLNALWFDPVTDSSFSYVGNNSSNAFIYFGESSSSNAGFGWKSRGSKHGGGKGHGDWGGSDPVELSGFQLEFANSAQYDLSNFMGGFIHVGTLRHFNRPIDNGTAIDGVGLHLSGNILLDGVLLQSFSFVYDFLHEETLNSGPCAYGNSSVNANGCADYVQFGTNSFASQFSVDGLLYNLTIGAFTPNGTIITEFLTPEDSKSQMKIYAHLDREVPVVDAVPEPSTWAMLLIGFGTIGMAARRRRTFVAQ